MIKFSSILLLVFSLLFSSCVKQRIKDNKKTVTTAKVIKSDFSDIWNSIFVVMVRELRYPIGFAEPNLGKFSTSWIKEFKDGKYYKYQTHISLTKIPEGVFVSVYKHLMVSDDNRNWEPLISDGLFENNLLQKIENKLCNSASTK